MTDGYTVDHCGWSCNIIYWINWSVHPIIHIWCYSWLLIHSFTMILT